MCADGPPLPRPRTAPPPGGRRRRRPGGHLRRRRAHPAGRRPGRRRPGRPAADAVRAGPARHRPRPPEDARDPRHPAPHPGPPAGPVRRQRRDRHRHLAGRAAPARRRRHLHLRRRRRPPARHRRRGPARQPRRHRPRRLVHAGTPTPTAPGSRRRWPARGRSWSSGSATWRSTSARVLARTPAELEPTDMPQHVLDALAATPVEEVTVLGRRGPAQATFTTQELRELGDLAARDRAGRPRRPRARPGRRGAGRDRPQRDPQPRRAPRLGRPRAPSPAARRLRLRFFARPVRLLGEDRVTGVEVERTAVDGDGPRRGHRRDRRAAGRPRRPLGRLLRARRCPGCRSTSARARCRNEAGRVLRDGRPSPGEYVAGWIKRGPERRRRHQQARRPGDRRRRCWPTPPTATLHRAGPVGDLVEELVARGAEPGAARRLAGDRRRRDGARRDARPGPDHAARAGGAAGRRPRRRSGPPSGSRASAASSVGRGGPVGRGRRDEPDPAVGVRA